MSLLLPWRTIGHHRQKQELEKNIHENNISHAYLFSGPSHIGKLHFAKELALALMCNDNMCRRCDTCSQIMHLQHSDVLILDMLFVKGGEENWETIGKYSNIPQNHRSSGGGVKTDIIGIESIRIIQKLLQEKSLGKYKICIISNIERMKQEAATAFLKSIEEPPKNVLFLFTTSRESNILPTFMSRLRKISFNILDTQLITEHIDEKHAKEILSYSQGRMGIALDLNESPEKLQHMKESYQEISTFFHSMSIIKRFAFAEKLSKNIDDIHDFMTHSLLYLRSQLDAENIKTALLIEQFEITQEYIKKNVNKRLALENLFLEI
jgi:DNA polymerase III subunit delta'